MTRSKPEVHSNLFIFNTVSVAFIIFLLVILLNQPVFSQNKIELRAVNWGGAEELKLEEDIADMFMQRYPEVTVRIETIPTGFKEKILTSIAAGSPPDVFLLDSTILPAFLNKSILVDLMPYLKRWGVDLSIYYPNILRIAMRDSHLYAIPKDFNPILMYYNKKLFRDAGVPFPQEGWTWSEFLETAQKLTRDIDGDGKIDVYGTGFSPHFYLWQPWLWANRTDILNPEGTSALGYFNSPESIETVSFLADLLTRYHVSPNVQALSGSGMLSGLFMSNRIGMICSGHWMVITLKKYMEDGDLEVGAIHLPVPPDGERVTVMYEAGWCVPRGTPNEEWAVRLATFLSGVEANRRRIEYGIAISSIESVARERIENDPYGIEEAFVNEVKNCRQPWGAVIEDFSRIELIAKDAMEEVMIRDTNVAATLNQAALKIDHELLQSKQVDQSHEIGSSRNQILMFLFTIFTFVFIFMLIFALWNKNAERKKIFAGYGFLLPSIVLFLVFILTPILFSLYLSMHQWNIINPDKPFVGLANYIEAFQDRYFLNALKNTALFTLQVPVGMMLSLAVALMMNQQIKGVYFLRTLYFLPSVTSFVAIAMVWQWAYHPQLGLINYVLSFFSINAQDWLTHPDTALISIMIMTIWLGIGYQMVIFLAGLQGIPDFLYDAARIDGASLWQRFVHITLPMLQPTTFFVLVTSIISSFQVFTSVYVMTQGGPSRSTDVVVYHIYQNAWEYLKMGYASAMSWILFVVILIATLIQFKIVGKRIDYA
ncbi:extracellular solute-binding protein [candidate division KSB1 bacterium]|nr:extracellular solute-binding protein [candidate division KSB1 bacterium]